MITAPSTVSTVPELAIQRMRDTYERLGMLDQMNEHLSSWMMLGGFFLCEPNAFYMIRPVERSSSAEEMCRLTRRFERPDCWFVFNAAVAGGYTLAALMARLPFHLDYIAFFRSGLRRTPRLRIYRAEKLEDRLWGSIPEHLMTET